MTVAALILTAILTLTIDINFIMLNPTGNPLSFVLQQVGWFSSITAGRYLIHFFCTLKQIPPVSDSQSSGSAWRAPLYCRLCDYTGKSYSRPQEVLRHIKSTHLTRLLYCPHFPCP